MNQSRPRIGIVGAGISGLVAALLLAHRGAPVILAEAAATPGGRIATHPLDGVPVPIGPALLTLRPIFARIFAEAGTRLDDHLQLTPQTHLGRHIFADGSRLDLPLAAEEAAAAIGRFAGASAIPGFRAFRTRAEATFETLDATMLSRERPTALGLAAGAGVGRLLATGPFTPLWDVLGSLFPDPRLRQLFGRTAAYVGTSPLQAPASLMLVAAVEQAGGWFIAGGLARLIAVLADLARAAGAEIRLNAQVADIALAGGRVAGLTLADGETLPCERIICTADPAALAAGRLGPAAARAVDPLPPARRSFSAIAMPMLGRLPPDAPHQSVLHAPDAVGEYAALALRGRMPATPTLTLLALDRVDGAPPPAGEERLLLLANAPARGDQGQPDAAAEAAFRQAALARLAAAGLDPAPRAEALLGPRAFEARFPGTGGALYGAAVQGWQATFNRPAARTRLPGLLLAGGGTHPGAGVAMAAASGRLAALAALESLPA